MKIPNIIHYCWFGGKEMPEKEVQCIETWKKFFPDYEFKLWTEENFDYTICNFAREAYENEKYAFVSDFVRAKVLYEYGGIYMDTDVEVLNTFPEVSAKGYLGFERRKFLGTAVMASEPKNKVIKQLVDFYENHSFIRKDGSIDTVANVSLLTDIMLEKGLKLGGDKQECEGFLIYPREMFYPKKLSETEFRVTEDTYAIHHCSNSWMSDKQKKRGKNRLWIEVIRPILQGNRRVLQKIVGKERTRDIEIKLRNKLK